jgi:transcriptional regulator with XRE-family HTH domain
MSFMFENIGKALAIVRQERGLSQQQLADRSVMGRAQLSRYESGRELMRLDTLEKMLKVLKVEPDKFFRLMTSLDESLEAPFDGPVDGETRLLEEAFQNLHAAVDRLQQTLERSLPPRALRRNAPSPAAGSAISQDDRATG